MESTPSPQLPKVRSRLRKFVIFFGVLVVVVIMGVIWTKATLQDDPNVTAAERESLVPRLNDLQPISLGLFLPVDSRVIQFEQTRADDQVKAYAVEYYSVFGIRMRTVELECWDARPGIDGVQTTETAPIGSLLGTIWCDGIQL